MDSLLDYSNFEVRLATFENWPKEWAFPSKEMAAAGFYYTACSDKVRCFNCGVEISNFNPPLSPWGYHSAKSPKCPHVKYNITPELQQVCSF